MTEELRVRVDRALLKEAKKVADQMGTTTGEIIRMLLTQLVKRRAIPFPTQADSPEDEVVAPAAWRANLWDDMESGKLNNPNAKPSAR